MRSSQDIVKDINKFEPTDGDWLELETLLNELWLTGNQESFTTDLLKVFERFPEEDGAGVFWSIVHGIERFRSYEIELLDSLKRQPSEMAILMLRRLRNVGATNIAGIEMGKVVGDLLSHKSISAPLKQELIKILAP